MRKERDLEIESNGGRRSSRPGIETLVLLLLYALIACVRAFSPSDLATGDQPYQVDYIRDIARNGAWVIQHRADGVIAAKPPLYNWLAAIAIQLFGEHEL